MYSIFLFSIAYSFNDIYLYYNFSLQNVIPISVLTFSTLWQMELIWDELGPNMEGLFQMGRSGVVASLIAACERLHINEHKVCNLVIVSRISGFLYTCCYFYYVLKLFYFILFHIFMKSLIAFLFLCGSVVKSLLKQCVQQTSLQNGLFHDYYFLIAISIVKINPIGSGKVEQK